MFHRSGFPSYEMMNVQERFTNYLSRGSVKSRDKDFGLIQHEDTSDTEEGDYFDANFISSDSNKIKSHPENQSVSVSKYP